MAHALNVHRVTLSCDIKYIQIQISHIVVNRRLDEWVPLDRVDLNQRIEDNGPHGDTQIVVTDLADSTDRKITRNQKRKHDEINHVQKVSQKPFQLHNSYETL